MQSSLRERPEWMTNVDVLILLALSSSDIIRVLSPSLIAYNIGVSREHASRRLGDLTEHGLVRRIEDGKYELTAEGRDFLAGAGHDD